MSMTESEAQKRLVHMVRMAGRALLPPEVTWASLVTGLDVTLATYARQVEDRAAQQRGTFEEVQELQRAVAEQERTMRQLRADLAASEAELAELRSTPELAKWHERATVAEGALKAHVRSQALVSDWLEDLRGYLEDAHDKVMRAYEIDAELSAARAARWQSEKLQGVKS